MATTVWQRVRNTSQKLSRLLILSALLVQGSLQSVEAEVVKPQLFPLLAEHEENKWQASGPLAPPEAPLQPARLRSDGADAPTDDGSLDNLSINWVGQIGSAESDRVNANAVDDIGSVYITGSTSGDLGINQGRSDFWMARYDTEGNQQWLIQEGTSEYDSGTGIAVSDNAEIYVAGFAADNAWVRKYRSTDGSALTDPYWIGDPLLPDSATGLVRDRDGYTYVAGWTRGDISAPNAGQTDFWLQQFGADDAPTWVVQRGTSRSDTPWDLAVDNVGNVYVTGRWGVPEDEDDYSDGWIAKFNRAGEQEWFDRIQTPTTEHGRTVTVGQDDHIYVAGWTDGALESYVSSGNRDLWLAKYHADGSQLWLKQFGASGDLQPFDSAATNSGGILITGSIDNAMWLAEFDGDGTQIGETVYAEGSGGNALAVAATDDLYVGGTTEKSWGATNAGKTDGVLIRLAPSRRPILLIHGILGSYSAATANHQEFLLNRGVAPTQLVIDPLTRAYDDLIQTFKNVGYTEGKDLFIVAYDWRLAPGPIDGTFDGHLDGLSATTVTDGLYQYGVDYLGYWLKQAAERWHEANPDEPLDSVDVITHSTGGLVARAYIQSDAYGDTFLADDGETLPLPRINNLVMVSVPNRGASQPWQAMNNNFIIDASSKYVIAKMLNLAYQKVKQGQEVSGFPGPITGEIIRDQFGNPDPVRFINLYVPTFRSLLATYDFLIDLDGDLINLNGLPEYRNDLLLDLNNGLDLPNQPPPTDASVFANRAKVTVYYADTEPTEYRVAESTSAASDVRFPLDAYFEQDVAEGILWYRGITEQLGDGTVPRESLAGQFEGDSRVRLVKVSSGKTTHTGLMSNQLVQRDILESLEIDWLEEDISTGLASASLTNIWNVTSDPVDLALVDAQGRRLGFTQSTGPLTEIPSSVWYGDADGLGWILGEVAAPLLIELTGLGEEYYVQVAGEQVNATGGYEGRGTLGAGETLVEDVPVKERGSQIYLPLSFR